MTRRITNNKSVHKFADLLEQHTGAQLTHCIKGKDKVYIETKGRIDADKLGKEIGAGVQKTKNGFFLHKI